MKRIFQFALVAFAAAAVVVACQKPPQQEQKPADTEKPDPGKPDPEQPGTEEVLPVEGNSAWSVIGALLGKNWDTDFVCAEQDGAFVLKNVKLSKDDQIKFRKDKGWDENRGINEPDKAAELAAGTPVQAIPGGGNIIIPADGIYDLYYFAEKEAIVYVAKDAALPEIPDFKGSEEPEPEPGPEPNFPDWANIGELTAGNHTFKFAKDDNFAYFYSYRTSEGRFNDIWDGNGYIYFALDFDNDLSTGEELNGNGKYEYIGFIYCFGAKPTVGIVKAGDCRPSDYTVDNIIAQGTADDNGVTVEYCIPLEDLPELPEEFTIYTWGNKDMSKVIYKVPYEAPEEISEAPITLDGEFEDWAEIEAIANSGSIKEWKYISDAQNVYFYFKIERSDIKAGKTADETGNFPFADRRYIYIGFDTDNDATTGDDPTSGDMTIKGCEALAIIYPFRGYSVEASGTDGAQVVNGEDEKSWIKIPAAGSKTGEHLSVYGLIEDDFGYLETCVPKAKIGSPAAGTWKVQFSLSSNLTGKDTGGDEIVVE